MKKLLVFILSLMLPLTALAVTAFNSSQVGSSPQNGYILQTNGSISTWVPSTSGGGSGGGTWSTTTSSVSGQLINYPNNPTDIVNIGSTSTTTGKFYFDPNLIDAFLQNIRVTLSTTTSATSTSFFTTTASTTNLFLATGPCSGSSALNVSNGKVTCGAISGIASTTLLQDNNAFTGLNTFTDLSAVTRSTTTSATSTNLYNSGNVVIGGTGNNTNAPLRINTTGSRVAHFKTTNTTGEFDLDALTTPFLVFMENGSPQWEILESAGVGCWWDPIRSECNLAFLHSGANGIGTSTPQWSLQIASSTKSQLTLSDGLVADNHWSFRNAGGLLYLATSSPTSFATSTTAALTIDGNGLPTLPSLGGTTGCIQADATGKFSNTGSACGSGSGGGNSKWATSTSPSLGISPNSAIYVGVGTTTPRWPVQVATSTTPQVTLSTGVVTDSHLSQRWTGGTYYLATSSPSTFATSTTASLTLDTTQASSLAVGSTTPTFSSVNGLVTLGSNGANGTTTISMGRLQFDGYDSGGTRRCVYITAAGALSVNSGACTQ